YFLYSSSPPGFSTTSTLTKIRCLPSIFSTAGRAWYLSKYLHQPHVGELKSRNTALLSFLALARPPGSSLSAGAPLALSSWVFCPPAGAAGEKKAKHSTAVMKRLMGNLQSLWGWCDYRALGRARQW